MIDVERIYALNFDRCGMVNADDKRLFALQAVAAAVREECAKHIAEVGVDWKAEGDYVKSYAADYLENRIRTLESAK